jgi:uncharacterized protein with HEPN domain
MYSRKNLVYVFTILECIEKSFIYSAECKTEEDFFEKNNQLVFNACYTMIMAVGEESNKIENALKENYPEINWKAIAGLRNLLAHDYAGVDYKVIYSVIKNHLPNLKEVVVDMIDKIGMEKSEIAEMVATPFYSHLKYLLEK